MPAIDTTDFTGEIVWLGVVPRDVPKGSIRSGARDRLDLDFAGAPGERHEGATRPACVRTTMMHPEGTEIRNVRQLTILAQEDLEFIAAEIGLDTLDPGLLGATAVLRGIPDFSHVPPSSRLQGPSGVTLTVDMENLPCLWPAKEIEADHTGHGKAFKAAAAGRHGVTAWVERPGTLEIGDRLRLFVPGQRAWAP